MTDCCEWGKEELWHFDRYTFPPFAVRLRRMGHPNVPGWEAGFSAAAAGAPLPVEMTEPWMGRRPAPGAEASFSCLIEKAKAEALEYLEAANQ
jgi:hypothetical protein